MLIKERIKNFDTCISFLKMIRLNVDDVVIKNATFELIHKLNELKEIFILSVTYSEVI